MKAIILTRSAMHGANCVAAIDMETGCFKRLVKCVEGTTFPLDDIDLYCRNTHLSCDPLDLVEIDVVKSCPFAHQTENIIINNTKGIRRIHQISMDELLKIHMPESEREYILGNKSRSLPEEEANLIGHSLELLEVGDLVIAKNGGSTRADFVYNGSHYNGFSVTDRKYYRLQEGQRNFIRNAIVVFSLAERPSEWRGIPTFMKFLAAIFPR